MRTRLTGKRSCLNSGRAPRFGDGWQRGGSCPTVGSDRFEGLTLDAGGYVTEE